ncbi:hypothetical protein DFH06DRAFT_358455 [Mycena polygramma]|nr:hypothetical protein DFH06DRAFT_358455 [Mycena polygramma]
MDSVALTLGPILFGGAVALMLSGVVAVQCIIFFKLYPDEGRIKTTMVATVWTLDAAQSCFILASLSDYFIAHFGDHTTARQNLIPWSIALTILLTAMQTCVVHLFYAQSIYRSSGKNWYLTGPIVCLASLRLLAAIVATIEMLHLRRWDAFSKPYPRLLFTAGLSLSAATDAIITACLCYYLRKIRKLSSSSVMKGVFDTLTLYTLENGLITCLTTVGSLTFWLALPASSIALSLHFIIGKLYPNSLLVLLNTRKGLREMHAGDQGIHFDPSDHLATYFTHFPHRAPAGQYSNHSAFMTAPIPPQPPPVQGYRPVFKMHQVTRRGGDSASIAESESEAQRAAPRSIGNTSLNWRALP